MRSLLCSLFISVAIAHQAIGAQPLLSGTPPATAAASAPQALAADRDMASLRSAERRRADAVGNNDVDALRTLIANDYYHVETNGRVRTRSEFLQLVAREEYEFRSYAVVSSEIVMFDSGRTAIVRGRFQADRQPNVSARAFRGLYVRVWQLGPDGWRNTMMQNTEIRPTR